MDIKINDICNKFIDLCIEKHPSLASKRDELIKTLAQTKIDMGFNEMVEKEKVKAKKICKWKFTRGARKAELCGKKSKPGQEYCSAHLRASKAKTTPILITKNRKFKKYWHRKSGMVFKSLDEQVVIGRIVDGQLFDKLEAADLEECAKYKFTLYRF